MTTLDLSNHDLATFNAACLRDAGVTRVIVGCWDLDATLRIVSECRDVGIIAEDLYGFLYFGLPWEQREVENAATVALRLGGIGRFWADLEADQPYESAAATPATRIAATDQALARATSFGAEGGIYSAPYYWPKMGNTTRYSSRRLWLPNYGSNDPNNPRPPILAVNFGGWTWPSIHQYSSSIPVCGRGRDHNYFLMGDDMALADDVAALQKDVARLNGLIGGFGLAKDPAAYIASGYDPALLTFGEEALAYAASKQWSAFLGIGLARQEAAAGAGADSGGPGDDVDHSQFVTRDQLAGARIQL